MAENIHDPSCLIPDCGVDWKITRQPITLADWPFTYDEQAKNFTTVMSWKTQPALPVVGGRVYGGKDVEFLRFKQLPRLVSSPLEVALSGPAPREEIAREGWVLVDAAERSSKAYAATESGWFSCRSACYLAMGKPVVVEETGISRHYRTGEGIWTFRNLDEAAAAIAAINANYRQQCEAARAMAERYFRAEIVLEQLLRDTGF
jgi:hypothetical protein